MSIYIYLYPSICIYVWLNKYVYIYVYVNIDILISLFNYDLSIQLSIYLSIYLVQSKLTYSSSSSLSIYLLSIDYAFIYWEGSPPPFKHWKNASLEFGAKQNGGISTELRYWTTSWNTSQQPIPSHWVEYISYQAIPDPLKQRIPVPAKVLQLNKKTNQHAFCMFLFKVLESHFHSWFPAKGVFHPLQPQNFTSASDSPQ